jgi:hypothetical protein
MPVFISICGKLYELPSGTHSPNVNNPYTVIMWEDGSIEIYISPKIPTVGESSF